jgi:hypothetical protein
MVKYCDNLIYNNNIEYRTIIIQPKFIFCYFLKIKMKNQNATRGKRDAVAQFLSKVGVARHVFLWVTLSYSEHPRKVMKKLAAIWTLLASVSGLIAGLTFVVLTTKIDFQDTPNMTAAERKTAYGMSISLAFLFSIASVFTAVLFLGFNNILLGQESNNDSQESEATDRILKYIRTFGFVADLPFHFLIISVFAMLAAGIILIGGLYSDIVWYCSIIAGSIVIGITFLLYLLMNYMVVSWISQDFSTSIKSGTFPAATIQVRPVESA